MLLKFQDTGESQGLGTNTFRIDSSIFGCPASVKSVSSHHGTAGSPADVGGRWG